MYKDRHLPASILIVKTSSLGDIVQAFNVLDDLKARFPNVHIDWAVERAFHSIVSAHPYIRRAIALDIKKNRNLWKNLKELREENYDLVFDLQGNCKSGVITALSRGKKKVGYGAKSVREWPNVLSTHIRFNISRQSNIRTFYLKLIESYFKTSPVHEIKGVGFRVELNEKEKIDQILSAIPQGFKIMVCPGAKWVNKQLKKSTLIAFLKKVQKEYQASFLLIWGDAVEKSLCEEISAEVDSGFVIDKLSIPAWQNLMNQSDLVIAVDSSALHLCGTTTTPSFSIFGPTSPMVFKPIGERHFAIHGSCPYGKVFEKQCPALRSCPTGACIKDLTPDEIFKAFEEHFARSGKIHF